MLVLLFLFTQVLFKALGFAVGCEKIGLRGFQKSVKIPTNQRNTFRISFSSSLIVWFFSFTFRNGIEIMLSIFLRSTLDVEKLVSTKLGTS
jgi:hypothetical protein